MPSKPSTPAEKLARRVVKTSQKVVGMKPRRTQAERRAATRGALLDAMLVSLVEDGYAGVTTRKVAQRAGVSQGTQQHYFASKTEFVLASMRYAMQKIADDVTSRIDFHAVHDPDKQEAVLDEIWRIHNSDLFRASLELWIAARTDSELRRELRKLEREITRFISRAARELAPEMQDDPVAMQMLDIALAAIRGLAMLAPVVPQAELERRWKVARGHLAAQMRGRLNELAAH